MEEEELAAVAVPEPPAPSPKLLPAPEQLSDDFEDSLDLALPGLANSTFSSASADRPGEGVESQADADGLSKGIQGLPRIPA